MNWKDFIDTVRTYLLVDSERKGRGVQNYINQLIRAGIIDLQRYVPELLVASLDSFRSADNATDWDSTKQYSVGDIVVKRNMSVNTNYGAQAYQACLLYTSPSPRD